jgi:hypothetical protein
MLSNIAEARRESRLRSCARRRGLILKKCRYRNPETLGYGGFMLVEASMNYVVLGSHPYLYSATLEEIAACLSE